MAEEVTEEQSVVLTEGEVEAVVKGEGIPEEVPASLPSDQVEFKVPEKFEGKSLEDVIKSYQELEKFKGGDTESKEGEEPSKEEVKEPTKVEAEEYQKYADSLDKNGKLSDAEYAELAEAGYDKATVDAEIQGRADREEFETYKKDRTLNAMLEPLGGGQDKFKSVSDWANTTKSADEVKAFNQELAASGPMAKQALLKELYSEYDSAGVEADSVLHSNTTLKQGNKGYATQEEFFKDVGSPEYQTNESYRKAVESKMALSDIF